MPQVIPHKSLSDTRLLQIIAGALVNPLTGEIFPIPATSVAWGNITGSLPDQTDLQAALDTKQPTDDDLTAISAIDGTGIYYRSQHGPPAGWSRVVMGSNMQFSGGVLNTVNFFTGAGGADDTAAPVGNTLDLTGLEGPLIDVTGNATIDTIILADGAKRLLRFTGTPTLTASAGLLTLGGVDIIVPSGGGISQVIGGTGGVVSTIQSFHDSNDYSWQTLDNIFMNESGNIGHASAFSGGFTIGKGGASSMYLQFVKNGDILIKKEGNFNNFAMLDVSLLGGGTPKGYAFPNQSGMFAVIENVVDEGVPRFKADLLTVERVFQFPDYPGTFSLIDGTETLTNKTINASQLVDETVTFAKIATGAWSDDVTMSADSSTLFPTQHAAKAYADNLKAGLKFKVDCRVASTANVNIASAPASIDSVTLANGDRALLKNQTAGAENGPYQFNGTGNAMTRTTDGDTGLELVSATFPIREGTVNEDVWWTIINDAITLGTTVIVFTQTGGAGTYVAGAGLDLTGNSFSIEDGGVTFAMLATGTWSNNPDDILLTPSGTVLPTTEAVASAMAVYVGGQGFTSYGEIAAGLTFTGQIKTSAGSTADDSAGIRLQSGALQTTPQAGAFEFLTDGFYLTKTTGGTRCSIVLGPAGGPITFAGPTAARIITVPNAASTMARTDAGNTFAEGANFALGTTTGSKIGTATSQKLAFHNSTPVIQRAGAVQAAVDTAAATNVTPYGFTQTQADAIVALVNELRASLVEKGLIKGAA